MAANPLSLVMTHLRRLALLRESGGLPDAKLLTLFVARHDEAAFEALVRRHGPMVMGVCRRVLRSHHDAEDAFQATFLILARKAALVASPNLISNWLYGVAYHTAIKAKATAARRRKHEREAKLPKANMPSDDARDLSTVLDQELSRLPEKYRALIVLCDLEGKTRKEAAARLGCPEGTVAGRLARGRALLAKRLIRRGVAVSTSAIASDISSNIASAGVSTSLISSTTKAAALYVAGQTAKGVISSQVAFLVEGVLQAMFLTKLKSVCVSGAAMFLALGLGVGLLASVDDGRAGMQSNEAPRNESKLAAAQQAAPKPKAAAAIAPKEGPLQLFGQFIDKDTSKPIAGATVTVLRSLERDPEQMNSDVLIEETKHRTDAEGKYSFAVAPEQAAKSYLYITLSVEHPEYAPKANFGNYLSTIRKHDRIGDPIFGKVGLRPGKAITGTVRTPDGQPVVGANVHGYSVTTQKGFRFEYGSFAKSQTDAQGRFGLIVTTPGTAVFWILPDDGAPSVHRFPDDKRGDLGTFTVEPGIRLKGKVMDVRGKPLLGVKVIADQYDGAAELQDLAVGNLIGRDAVSDERGEFIMKPLPPGRFTVSVADYASDGAHPGKRIPIPDVFLRQTFTLKNDSPPIEIRAHAHVVIEAQYYDSKGQKTRGRDGTLYGQLDKNSRYRADAKVDADGKMTGKIPHGLENAYLAFEPYDDSSLRYRRSKDEPYGIDGGVNLGTVSDDVRGIEIIRYKAPVVAAKIIAKDGAQLPEARLSARYTSGKGPKLPTPVDAPRTEVPFYRQKDGRFHTGYLVPDEDVEITAEAPGYKSRTMTLRVPEGETRDVEFVLEK